MQMICFGVRILIEMQYDAGYPLTETNDIGYGVLHECGIGCGKVHRRNMKDGYPAVFVQRHDSRFYGRTE